MDSEKDKKVKRIARFLELGGTMLAEHCKVCGAPKFRYQGTVICPICDVREEEESKEPAEEVQAPEPRPYTEKDRPSFDTKKRVQAHRQKPRFGLKSSEAAEEEEKAIEPVEEEIPGISPEKEKTGRAVPAVFATPAIQAAPTGRVEKPAVSASKMSGIHGDRKVLEDLLFKKMVNIADSLQDEADPRSVAEDLELIEKGLGLIERLRQI
ncbi:Sjogren's syndrome/scleroderma autoantigen 1 family protein [Methanosarcina sp.]|uniref:Sjogren's syndrome/scleroderma autoantigen 1 family protein n=1 Tax=Methanosarcina sp. TaxID=2213 RepID=UPI003C77EDD2